MFLVSTYEDQLLKPTLIQTFCIFLYLYSFRCSVANTKNLLCANKYLYTQRIDSSNTGDE